jgi:hypothetical protein
VRALTDAAVKPFDVAALGVGATFDITFRVVNVATSVVVLTSDCYRYTISQ